MGWRAPRHRQGWRRSHSRRRPHERGGVACPEHFAFVPGKLTQNSDVTQRFVLHVGPHKTGSTYLQCAFTVAVHDLRARGILYPRGCGSLQGHFPLVHLLQERDTAALRAWFDGFAATGAATVLLSSENFVFLDRAELLALRALMGNAPVTIVFYGRRPSEILLSGWRELVKHGVTTGLPEFIVQALTHAPHTEPVNLAQPLTRLAGVFGADALRLVPYNTILDAGENLFRHFCATFLDWPDAPEPTIRPMNRSLSAEDAELLRAINMLEERRTGAAEPRLYHRLIANRGELDLTVPVQAMARHAATIMIDEARPPFLPWQRTVRERFGHALTAPGTDSQLFTPIEAALPYIRADYLAEPGIPDALRAAHARLLTIPDPEPMAFILRHL